MSHKSKKSAKAAFGRAAGLEKEKSNKHITKITANSSKPDQNPNVKTAKTPDNPSTAKDRPTTAVAAKTAANTPEMASDGKKSAKTSAKIDQKATKADKKSAKADKKAAKVAKKDRKSGAEKPLKDVFILARPFVALGRYLRDSWREIRRVRWPNRKATWKMTGAVLAYCAAFMVFIVLLDSLFTWLFGLIIK